MLGEAKDRTIEAACERLLVKPVWSQMKQNADAGADVGGGLSLIAKHLATLRQEFRNLEVNLIGHSAGSILLGHLLTRLAGRVPVNTCSLYAPACSIPFALRHFIPPVEQRVLSKSNLFCDILTDERERADSVGPYGKSLLYLVSRALENVHKTPLLGMETAWPRGPKFEDQWHRSYAADLARWHKFAAGDIRPKRHGADRANVSDGVEMIPLAHGSFDNDIAVVDQTLRRIHGGRLIAPVTNLHGF
jgi:pimeloyl-ACP methyl ester carboxylesterase